MKTTTLKSLFLPTFAIILLTLYSVPGKAALEAKFSTDAPQWQGNSVNFWDQSTSLPGYITQWEWNFGDDNYMIINNLPIQVTHTYTLSGNYNVTLTVTNSLGATASITQEVPIISILLPITNFWSNEAICESGLIGFSDVSQSPSGTSIISRSWDFGDPFSSENSSTIQNPLHLYTKVGSYNVTLTVFNNLNQSFTIKKQVNVYPAPIADFTCSTQKCDSQTVNFKNVCSTSEGFINVYVWHFGDGNVQWVLYPDNPDVSHTYSQPGSYNVTLDIAVAINPGTTDSCYSHITKQVITPLLPAQFTFTTPVLNQPVQFTDESKACSANLTEWNWDFGDGNTSTIQNPEHTYTIPGNYAVALNIKDSKGNSGNADSVLFVPVTGKSSIIKGKILVGTETINDATIKLVQINASGFPVSSRTTSPAIGGNYVLENVPDGNYYLLAYPKIDGAVASKFLPTYYTKSVYWPSATMINLGQAQDQYDIQLEFYTILKGGNLSINGQLLNSGKSLIPAEQEVLLLDNQNNPVRWTFTDLAGNYSFDSLPAGNYRVNPVMSGLTSFPSLVDLNENTSPAFVKMYISGQIITGTSEKELAKNMFKIYPNPAHDILNIEMNGSSGAYPSEIISTSGRILKTARIIPGTNKIQISNLPSGLYLIRITDTNGSQCMQKFIKQ